ncbi:MAG: HlyD family efflux transporter periplasmic adaptor subunit, partial [Bacteroidota bacterium]
QFCTTFSVFAELLSSGTISQVDYENSERNFVETQLESERFSTNIVNLKIEISQLKSNLATVKDEDRLDTESRRNRLNSALEKLKTSVDQWLIKNLYLSPVNGILIYENDDTDNIFFNRGDRMFSVRPNEDSQLYARAAATGLGTGKIEVGQRVNLKFEDYPAEEFGFVVGRVTKIAPIISNRTYDLSISLPDGLMTSYGNTISFKPGLAANAEIITADQRLINRIFYQIRKITDNG